MSMMHPALARLKALMAAILGRVIIRSPTLAVFIDGDGVLPKGTRKVLDDLSVKGRVCLLRRYGNFTGKSVEGWANLIRGRGLVARHMTSLVPGKNATDIVLTIDVIDVQLTEISTRLFSS